MQATTCKVPLQLAAKQSKSIHIHLFGELFPALFDGARVVRLRDAAAHAMPWDTFCFTQGRLTTPRVP